MSLSENPGAGVRADGVSRAVRFLCDEMLAKTGRWLRAAGYDTAIAVPGADDCAIIAVAAAEQRVLLTRDRELAAFAARRVAVAALARGEVDAAALELRDRLGIDWLRAPFTRCLVDNAPLRPAAEAERAAMPPRARAVGGEVNAGPECGRLYWPGSHVRRMQAKLAAWAAGRPGPAPAE